jgi:GNAT superfamily N-acetyltransferase
VLAALTRALSGLARLTAHTIFGADLPGLHDGEPDRAVGYFSIAAAVEQRSALPSAKLRRGMPKQVPLLLIGHLAVDAQWRGRGLGSALLGDALRRCLAASDIAGVRALSPTLSLAV